MVISAAGDLLWSYSHSEWKLALSCRFTALTLVTDLQNTCDSPWHTHNKVKLPACSRVKCPLDTYIFFINDFGKRSGVRTSQGQSASLAGWALGRSWCEGSVQCLMSILGQALSAWHGHWASPGPSSFSSSSPDCSVTVAVNPTTDKNGTSAVTSKYLFFFFFRFCLKMLEKTKILPLVWDHLKFELLIWTRVRN